MHHDSRIVATACQGLASGRASHEDSVAKPGTAAISTSTLGAKAFGASSFTRRAILTSACHRHQEDLKGTSLGPWKTRRSVDPVETLFSFSFLRLGRRRRPSMTPRGEIEYLSRGHGLRFSWPTSTHTEATHMCRQGAKAELLPGVVRLTDQATTSD